MEGRAVTRAAIVVVVKCILKLSIMEGLVESVGGGNWMSEK